MTVFPLPASGGSRHFLVCGCITPVSASIFTSFPVLSVNDSFVCLIRTLVIVFRSHPDNLRQSPLKILNLILSAKTPFPNKVTLTGSGSLDVDVSLEAGGGERAPFNLLQHLSQQSWFLSLTS